MLPKMVAALLVLTVPAIAGAAGDKERSSTVKKKPDRRSLADTEKRTLSARELGRYMSPYAPVIKKCYVKHALKQKAATGELRVEVIVHRKGHLFHLAVVAPGVRGKGLATCIRRASKKWKFPPRLGFTTAVVPFYFLKTHAKGAGPTISCWSRRGCPKQMRARRKARQAAAKRKKRGK